MRELVVAAGVHSATDIPSAVDIVAFIERNPAVVESWIDYSAEKRSSDAWYFVPTSAGRYEVGLFPAGPNTVFTSGAMACAEFIARELASICAHERPGT